jgi:putative oxidoreductase
MSRTLSSIVGNKYVVFAVRVVLGLVFIYASIDKIAHPDGFAQNIYNYRMLPHTVINVMAIIMPWMELACGALIVTGVFLRGSALWIALMLLIFIMALSNAVARGLDIDCGCFRVEGGHSAGVRRLIEDVFMFAGALIVLFHASPALSLSRRSR